jgi:endosialidase-like protein
MTRTSFHYKCVLVTMLVLFQLSAATAIAQTTGFTYQGRLTDGGTAPTGNYDLLFALFDSLSGGAPIGSTQTLNTVAVSNGVFTVTLDFGANAFPGASRFLEISARPSGGGAFTMLGPRQQITSTPYAIRSLKASTADAVTSGGTLSATILNASSQYNLNGSRILSNPGINNLFAGVGAGQNNTGDQNSFFGLSAGFSNTTGRNNAFFGQAAGSFNTTGAKNSFFGSFAGQQNTVGSDNAFFGTAAGSMNTSGGENSFFGAHIGLTNRTGTGNTLIGTWSDFGADNLTNATAIGAYAQAGQSDSLVLGSIAGVNNAASSVNVGIGTTTPKHRLSVIGGPGWTSNGWIGSLELQNASAIGWRSNGAQSFGIGQSGGGLYFFRTASAPATVGEPASYDLFISDLGNVGIATITPQATLDVGGAAVFRPSGVGSTREISLGSPGGETGIGIRGTSNRADVRFDGLSLRLVAGTGTGPPAATNGINITKEGVVGIGTTSPAGGSGSLDVNGLIFLRFMYPGANQSLCWNFTDKGIGQCGSSLRYKRDVAPFNSGLDLLRRLRPISFTWKTDGSRDLGLGAEDVAQVEPLLITHNDQGEIEGVKYDRLSIVFINAIKEQQAQIETLRAQNAALNTRLRAIEKRLQRPVAVRRRTRLKDSLKLH